MRDPGRLFLTTIGARLELGARFGEAVAWLKMAVAPIAAPQAFHDLYVSEITGRRSLIEAGAMTSVAWGAVS
jgi:hypothetical protein